MRSIKCNEISQEIRCPICHKVLMTAGGECKPCRHVRVWHNNIVNDVCIATNKAKEKIQAWIDQQTKANKDADEVSAIVALYDKKSEFVVVQFDSGYVGGDMTAIDTISFKKPAQPMIQLSGRTNRR